MAVGKVRLSAFPRGGVASLFFSPTAPCGRERVHANVCTNSLGEAYEIPRIQHFVAYKIGRFVRFLGSFWKRGLRSCTAHRAVAGGPGAEGASTGRQTCRGGDRRRVPSLGDTAGRQRPAQGRPLPPVRDVAACVLTPAGPAGLHGVPRACLTAGRRGALARDSGRVAPRDSAQRCRPRVTVPGDRRAGAGLSELCGNRPRPWCWTPRGRRPLPSPSKFHILNFSFALKNILWKTAGDDGVGSIPLGPPSSWWPRHAPSWPPWWEE